MAENSLENLKIFFTERWTVWFSLYRGLCFGWMFFY